MKFFEFMRVFGNDQTIVENLRCRQLLKSSFLCDSCGETMKERPEKGTDGLIFRCDKRSCGKKKSIRSESFFEKSKLSLFDAMLFLHLWSKSYTEKIILDDFNYSKVTVVDWFRFCRELCVDYFESDVTTIGGPGCVVELDETLAVRRKYNRGRMLRDGWIFGGIERRADGQFRCFVCMVYDRSEAHLTYLIRKHVALGTHIVTDGWAAYRNLSSMGYTHSVVIHGENFVSPSNPNVHTQTIEATWSSLKRFIRSRGTYKGPHYLEYICEYIFRRKHDDVFAALLETISHKYTNITQ